MTNVNEAEKPGPDGISYSELHSLIWDIMLVKQAWLNWKSSDELTDPVMFEIIEKTRYFVLRLKADPQLFEIFRDLHGNPMKKGEIVTTDAIVQYCVEKYGHCGPAAITGKGKSAIADIVTLIDRVTVENYSGGKTEYFEDFSLSEFANWRHEVDD